MDPSIGEQIWRSVESNHVDGLQQLVAANTNSELNWQDNNGRTALMLSVANSNIDAVRILLAGGADVNRVDNLGCSALMLAAVVSGGLNEIVRLLLVAGADVLPTVTSGPYQGLNAMALAIKSGNCEVAAVLKAKEEEEERNAGRQLYDAAKDGDIAKLQRLLTHYAGNVLVLNWSHPKHSNCTPLIIACQKGQSEAVMLLLSTRGVSVNRSTKTGCTPLIRAVSRGHYDVTRILLSCPGIDYNLAVDDGYTALLCAARWDYVDILRLLLSMPNIALNTGDREGRTPLMEGSEMGNVEVVRILLSTRGLDINSRVKEGLWRGNTALDFAVREKKADCVSLLRAAGAKSGADFASDGSSGSAGGGLKNRSSSTFAGEGPFSDRPTSHSVHFHPSVTKSPINPVGDSIIALFKSDSHLVVFLVGVLTTLIAVRFALLIKII